MKHWSFVKFSYIIISVLILGTTGFPQQVHAETTVDNSAYAELLAAYVKGGVVDYAGIKGEESKLDEYLRVLENTDAKALSTADQFAFYTNAYNAWTIKLILSRYPGIKSIKDLGSLFKSPWKKKFVRIDGGITTLDHIEHDILRPRFKDPRVHFAVNCASIGCPPLLSQPYMGNMLDVQLDGATRGFVNDKEKNRLEGDTLYVSSIFKWFSEDFGNDVKGFFIKYADNVMKKDLIEERDKLTVKYLKYDWSLNGK
jgi:uncharacterized protein DUF547